MPTQDDIIDDQQPLLPSELDDFELCQPVTTAAVNGDGGEEEEDNNDDETSSSMSGPKKKKQKVECAIENCKNTAQEGGTCIKHGGKYKRRYYCSVEGCTRYPKRGGLCKSHGAKITRPRCQIEGCTNVETNKGVCIRHGAKVKLCTVENCPNQSLKGGVCWSHGAKNTKVKKRCSVEGCDSIAYKKGVCAKHGAKRCSMEGCNNQAKQGGVCISHGATPVKRKLCSVSGCPNQSKVEGYCKRHKTMITNAQKEATTVVVAHPGKLGLTLKIDAELGGAMITAVDSESTLNGRIQVGDRIISIDDHVITQISDFGINSDKTRQFHIAVKNSVETVLFNEVSELGERMKMQLSGVEVAEMSSQIQRLIQVQEEALSREATLNTQLQRAQAKETALEAQLKEIKSRAKELKDENVTLKASLAREQRRAKKCPTCKEKANNMKSPDVDMV
jgi:hypothetical protein